MVRKLVEIALDAAVVQGLFLGIVLTTNKNRNRISNKILAVLLVVLSLSIAHSVFFAPTIDSPYKIREPFILLIGPLLSFYIRDLTGGWRLTKRDILRLFPFALLLLLVFTIWMGGDSLPYTKWFFQNALHASKGIWALIVFQYAYYWWLSLRLLMKHRAAVESEFSNTEGKTLSWLHLFLHVFGAFLVLLAATLVLAFHTSHYAEIDIIVCLGLAGTIFVLGYFGLFQEEIFAVPGDTINPEKPRQTPEKEMDLALKLQEFIREKKPYLSESLTLTDLAMQFGVTRNQLSSLINNSLGDNFYTMINRYRVDEAKRLIADPKNANFTLLSLAYEAGFPSKSSFHAIFKKFTGETPAGYRKKFH